MEYSDKTLQELNDSADLASEAMNQGAAALNQAYMLAQVHETDGMDGILSDINDSINVAAAKAIAKVDESTQGEYDLEAALKVNDYVTEQQLSVLSEVLEDLLDLMVEVGTLTRGMLAVTYSYYLLAYQSASQYQDLRFPMDEDYITFLEQAFESGAYAAHPLGSEA